MLRRSDGGARSITNRYTRVRNLLGPLVNLYARVQLERHSPWPEDGRGVILASNHAGHLWWDSLCLAAAFPDIQIRFIAHHWDAKIGPIKKLLDQLDVLYLDAQLENISPDNAVVNALKSGAVTCLYPEESYHTFWRRYTVHRLSPHILKYAQLARVPIVPTAMIGVEEAAPCLLGYKPSGVPLHIPVLPPLILPMKVTILLGEPTSFEALTGMDPEQEATTEILQRGADKLQLQMAALIRKHRPRARTSQLRYIDHQGWW